MNYEIFLNHFLSHLVFFLTTMLQSGKCIYFQEYMVLIKANLGTYRSSPPEVFLGKGARPCRSNFIEITLRHVCFPVNLLHFFRTPLLKNTSGRLLLHLQIKYNVYYLNQLKSKKKKKKKR